MESGGSVNAIVIVIQLALVIFGIVISWIVYSKAEWPGWTCLVPFYNIYVMLKIAGKPGWWLILMFIPIVNIVFGIMAIAGLSRNFGKGTGFTLGLIFLYPIFMAILAFGGAEYEGESE